MSVIDQMARQWDTAKAVPITLMLLQMYVMVKQTVFITERIALPAIPVEELPSTLLSNTNVFEQSNTFNSYLNNLKVFLESSV